MKSYLIPIFDHVINEYLMKMLYLSYPWTNFYELKFYEILISKYWQSLMLLFVNILVFYLIFYLFHFPFKIHYKLNMQDFLTNGLDISDLTTLIICSRFISCINIDFSLDLLGPWKICSHMLSDQNLAQIQFFSNE